MKRPRYYTPKDAPRLSVEYIYSPPDPEVNAPADVEICGINCGDSPNLVPWLERHGFDFEGLSEEILESVDDRE